MERKARLLSLAEKSQRVAGNLPCSTMAEFHVIFLVVSHGVMTPGKSVEGERERDG